MRTHKKLFLVLLAFVLGAVLAAIPVGSALIAEANGSILYHNVSVTGSTIGDWDKQVTTARYGYSDCSNAIVINTADNPLTNAASFNNEIFVVPGTIATVNFQIKTTYASGYSYLVLPSVGNGYALNLPDGIYELEAKTPDSDNVMSYNIAFPDENGALPTGDYDFAIIPEKAESNSFLLELCLYISETYGEDVNYYCGDSCHVRFYLKDSLNAIPLIGIDNTWGYADEKTVFIDSDWTTSSESPYNYSLKFYDPDFLAETDTYSYEFTDNISAYFGTVDISHTGFSAENPYVTVTIHKIAAFPTSYVRGTLTIKRTFATSDSPIKVCTLNFEATAEREGTFAMQREGLSAQTIDVLLRDRLFSSDVMSKDINLSGYDVDFHILDIDQFISYTAEPTLLNSDSWIGEISHSNVKYADTLYFRTGSGEKVLLPKGQYYLVATAKDARSSFIAYAYTYFEIFESNVDMTLINNTVAAINALPSPVTLSDGDAIDACVAMYNNLTDNQKRTVTNYGKLQEAVNRYALLKDAQSTEQLIAALYPTGELTLTDEASVNEARSSFDALSSEIKAVITNYETLVAAESRIALLRSAANVANVTELISSIGEPSLTTSFPENLFRADNAYYALTADERGQVNNVDVLNSAWEAYSLLKSESSGSSGFEVSISPNGGKIYLFLAPVNGESVTETVDLTASVSIEGNYYFSWQLSTGGIVSYIFPDTSSSATIRITPTSSGEVTIMAAVSSYDEMDEGRSAFDVVTIVVYGGEKILEAEDAIAALADLTPTYPNEDAYVAYVAAKRAYESLSAAEKARVVNVQKLLNFGAAYAAAKETYQSQEEAAVTSLTLNVPDKTYLYLSDGSSQSFNISVTTKLSDLSTNLKWVVTNPNVISFKQGEDGSLLVSPLKLGTTDILAVYTFQSGRTIVKTITATVVNDPPAAIISVTKDGEGAFTIYEDLTVEGGLNMALTLQNVTYRWFIDGVENTSLTFDSFSYRFSEGIHTIKLLINAPDLGLDEFETSRHINVSTIPEAQKVLSVDVSDKVYLILNSGEARINALLDGVLDTEYEYGWNITDSSKVAFKYPPQTSSYAVITPVAAGSTKLYVMTDIGRYTETLVIKEVEIVVLDSCTDVVVGSSDTYYKPGTVTTYTLTVNGIAVADVLNATPTWSPSLNKEAVEFTQNADGSIDINHSETGRYAVSVTVCGVTGTKNIQIASVPLDKIILFFIPIVIVLAAVLILIRVLTRGKMDKLAAIKKTLASTEKNIISLKKYIATAKPSAIKSLLVKLRFYRIRVSLNNAKTLAGSYYIEAGMEEGSLVQTLNEAALVLRAISMTQKSYKDKMALIKDLNKFKKTLIYNAKVCVDETIAIRESYNAEIEKDKDKLEVPKPLEAQAIIAKIDRKSTVDKALEYLRSKNMYDADKDDDDNDAE